MAEINLQNEKGFNQIFAPVGSPPLRASRRNDRFVAQAHLVLQLDDALRALHSLSNRNVAVTTRDFLLTGAPPSCDRARAGGHRTDTPA
jgi:hypothetical protein